MKILYFHQHFTTPKGSTGTRSYEFAKRLIARGHQVTMVCGTTAVTSSGLTGEPTNGMRRGFVEGIDVVEFVIPYENNFGLIKRALAFIDFGKKSSKFALTEPHDLIFSTTTPLTAGIPGILSKRFGKKKPFVFEVRDLWPELPRAMGMKNPVLLYGMTLLERWSYRAADACIGLSPGIVEGIKRVAGSNKNVALIPNGCDLDVFVRKAKSGADNLKSLDERIAPTDFVAFYGGAHGLANGLGAVLDAATVLKNRGHLSIKFLLVGAGKTKMDLVERAKQEGLDNVIFLDKVPKKEMNTILNSVDVGLMILANIPAFYYGTSPNKFFDYISAGLPVLVNHPGWLTDLVRENECGVAVEPENPEAFADALIQLQNHPDLHQMGERGRILAERQFSRDDLASQFADFLEKVAQEA